MKRCSWLAAAWLLCGFLPTISQGGDTAVGLKFSEVYDLVRGALTNKTDAELNQLAITGFLESLKGQVLLGNKPLTNSQPTSETIGRKTVFDQFYGYIRLNRVDGEAPNDFWQGYQSLRATNKLKGFVLDLRFADGSDYVAAARLADHFLTTEAPLLKHGDQIIQSTVKTNAVSVPVTVLINHETSGAAEALAGIMRYSDVALLIGGNTAGRALEFQEFSLSNGEKLKIAKFPVQVGKGQLLGAAGVAPDIAVETSLAEEKAGLDDPFRQSFKPATPKASPTNNVATRPTRRSFNEAELVRRLREGADPDLPGKPEDLVPTMTDASLARSIDFLKGLTLVQRLRPTP